MAHEMRPELGFLRRERARAGVAQELHLLPQPPPDHRVVTVEPERQRLAIVDLLAHEVLDQPRQLRVGRRPPPYGLELPRQPLDLGRRHRDHLRRAGRVCRSRGAIEAEYRGADQEKVQQRLAHQATPEAAAGSPLHLSPGAGHARIRLPPARSWRCASLECLPPCRGRRGFQTTTGRLSSLSARLLRPRAELAGGAG